MRKVSELTKSKSAIKLLYEISVGNNPTESKAQIGNLAKHGFIIVHPGFQLELTPKGRAKADLFREDEKEFDIKVKESLERKPVNLGTMPLFYEGCKECDKQRKTFKKWVDEDVLAIEEHIERPQLPIFKVHEHG